jgi:hypothetical protein
MAAIGNILIGTSVSLNIPGGGLRNYRRLVD